MSAEMRKQFHAFKLLKSSGQAPSGAPPQVPSQVDHRVLQSSSEDLCQSSSYDDTRNLLDITQRSQWVASSGNPIAADAKATPYPVQTPHHIIDRNPYRHALNAGHFTISSAAADTSPQSSPPRNDCHEVLMNANGEDEVNAPRLALERDVSRALRLTSVCSNSSRDLSAWDQGNGGCQSSTDSSGLLGFFGREGQRHSIGENSKLKGFYHESAIHQTWLGSQQLERIRIPVNHRGSVSSSLHPPQSTGDYSDLICLDRQNDDLNDWETVPESGIASGAVTNPHSWMGEVNLAGSSVANTSDDGNSPLIYQHSDFSSTERIIQHPGQIEYFHDYRMREIRDGSFPVLLPSYQQYTINGFPANSYRSLSPFQQSSGAFHYRHPSPLSRGHTNPFQSPPPETIDVRQRSDEAERPVNMVGGQILGLNPTNYSTELLNKERDDVDRWMDEFDDLRPVVSPGDAAYAEQATDSFGNFSSVSHNPSRTVGSSIADASFSTLGALIDEPGQAHEQEIPALARARYDVVSDPLTREKFPFVKRPPGAFYQGVRSRPDPRRKGMSLDRLNNSPPKQVSQPYPTNQMRPLSLLKVNPQQIMIDMDERLPRITRHDNFFYRSPLAPVKSRNWRTLYTREQLSLIRNAAKDDGMCDIESQRSHSSRPQLGQDIEANGSWKRIPWSPHMFGWPRVNSSIDTDLGTQKTKISNIVFGLCCLFPPLLVLFGFGYMDNMILWITEGEITAFSQTHKRVALKMVCFVLIAVLIAIPVIVLVTVFGHA